MKKKLCLILVLLIFMAGCTVLNDNDINGIIKTILYNKNNLSNNNFEGYKFYLPRGCKVIDKNNHNIRIKNNNINYYLYIDAIAYYHKTRVEYNKDSSIYYSQSLVNGDYFGFIDIKEIENKYFIVIMYNYSKIESYVDKDNLDEALTNICYILSTVKFNDSILETIYGNGKVSYQTEVFDIFSSKRENDIFLTYAEEYDKYVDNVNDRQSDEDTIIVESDE